MWVFCTAEHSTAPNVAFLHGTALGHCMVLHEATAQHSMRSLHSTACGHFTTQHEATAQHSMRLSCL